jgi:four helix bundle protein
MAKDNLILTKSYSFALDIIQLYQYLNKEKKEYVISKQILKSGTSIGANAEEASAGISKKEFVAKFQISYKEAKKTIIG